MKTQTTTKTKSQSNKEKKESEREKKLIQNGCLTREGITNISFNKDLTKCILSKKGKDIYQCTIGKLEDISTWKIDPTPFAEGHSSDVKSLDWNPISNRIISSSTDKTCIIWEQEKNNTEWTPKRAVIKAKLGYLFAYWNKRGDKFVAGTSDSKLFIGSFDKEKVFWIGNKIDIHKHSVVSAKFNESSAFCISGSVDNKIYITSTYIENLDKNYLSDYEKKMDIPKFGQKIIKIDCNSWITDVAFSPMGVIAFGTSQNSLFYEINFSKNYKKAIQFDNPTAFKMIMPKDDTHVYVTGYDNQIYLYYKNSSGNWLNENVSDKSENVQRNSPKIDFFTGNKPEIKERFIFDEKQKIHLHFSDISASILIPAKDNNSVDKIITTDKRGFIKIWTNTIGNI